MNQETIVKLLLSNHNAHAAVLETFRQQNIPPYDNDFAHIFNEIFYNYFMTNVSIHNNQINSIEQLILKFEKFEERIAKKIEEQS